MILGKEDYYALLLLLGGRLGLPTGGTRRAVVDDDDEVALGVNFSSSSFRVLYCRPDFFFVPLLGTAAACAKVVGGSFD